MARRGLVEVRRGAGRPQLPPGGYGYVLAVREQQPVRCAAISQGPRQLAPVDRVRPGHAGGGGSELAVRTIPCGPVRRFLAREARPDAPQRRGECRHADRSEEHTSELQSPCNLVCRLLLEKKKKDI